MQAKKKTAATAAWGLRVGAVTLAGAATAAWGQQAPQADAQLEAVVVTASGVQQRIKDAPASISVLTQEDLQKGNYQSVADAVRHVEGVAVVGDGPNTTDIMIRGLPGEYTLILIDGQRQNTRETMNRGTTGVQANLLPPLSAIERIEVVRGPMSSLYGADAMGGVINIITKKVPARWSGSVGGSVTLQGDHDYGNTRAGEFWLGGPIQNDVLGLQVWGKTENRSEAGNHYPAADSAFGRENRSLGAKLTARPDSRQEIVFDVGTEDTTTETTPGRSILPSQDWSRVRHTREHYGLTHNGRWSFGQSKLSLYREVGKNESWPQAKNYSQREVTNTTLDGNLTLPVANHLLRLGGQYQRVALDGIRNEATVGGYPVNLNSVTLNNYALFLEDDWMLTERLTLTGGVRMDDDERHGRHWSPRLYGVYHASDALTLRGGVTTGFKAPSIRQSTAGYCMSTGGNSGFRGPLCGNPDLKPETSTTQELGLGYEWAPASRFTATLFNTNFKNKVVSFDTGKPDPLNPTSANHLYVYDNVDKVRIRGLEMGLQLPLAKTLSLNANYTYTQSRRKGGTETAFDGSSLDGKPLEKTPKHMLNAQLDWQATERLTTFARLNFMGKASYAAFRNGARGVRERGSSATLDLGGSYQLVKDVSLRFALLNLTDRKVPVDLRERNTGLSGNWMADEGRRLWVGVNASF
ncbi:MAG: TonB-dependent receptor [Acidovorax sp.]|jgi:outer membrane receptor for ferrienterochelin and colicins|nr:TonB-dependent receptor [Acidovorax sp.]